MLEAYGNIWDIADEFKDSINAVVVTTNGYTRKDGNAVMGRGIAKEAADRYPSLPYELGARLLAHGNVVNIFSYLNTAYDIVTFPVKPRFGSRGIPGWQARADLDLIASSARELVRYADRYNWMDVLMPRPGCGYGQLKWEQVKPVIEPILDNRFTVVTFHP